MGSSLFGDNPDHQQQNQISTNVYNADNQQQRNPQVNYAATKVTNNYIPSIPTFEPPELQLPPINLYDACLVARQPPKSYSKKRLESKGNVDLKRIRDELISDCSSMVQRLKQIGCD